MNTNTEELASLYVLDKLPPVERHSFEERLESDTELLLLVRELENALEAQIRALRQEKVPPDIFQRIEERIRSSASPKSDKPVITIPWATFAGWGMAASLLLGVGLTLFFTSGKPTSPTPNYQPVVLVVGMDSNSSVVKAVPSVMPVDGEDNFAQLANMAEMYWKHPEQLPVNIQKSPLANTKGSGYAVFDPQTKRGFIAIHKLPIKQKGKNYFLWLKDAASNVLENAGMIPIQNVDDGLYFFELNDKSPISSSQVAFFITEEDTGDVEIVLPRGELVLGSEQI